MKSERLDRSGSREKGMQAFLCKYKHVQETGLLLHDSTHFGIQDQTSIYGRL
jgi:hypothetical protein